MVTNGSYYTNVYLNNSIYNLPEKANDTPIMTCHQPAGILSSAKVATTKDAAAIAALAYRAFGNPSIEARRIIFSIWQKGCRNGMFVIKEGEEPVGYVLCLALDSIALAHMAGELDQFNLTGQHLRQQSDKIYIQAIYSDPMRAENNSAISMLMMRTLYRAIKGLIAPDVDEVTLYFEQYSRTTAKWAKELEFMRLPDPSAGGHPIWKITMHKGDKTPPPMQRLLKF